MKVRVSVRGGVAYVDAVPPGVVVEVVDYDVDPETNEADERGEPCSRYEVHSAIALMGSGPRLLSGVA